ncbi:MAG: TIGR03663 family protein [Herpetosiphonaceae bacterium]|nr:TIGR03663 family protein [Herpetosiphonaceae bacterium]
MVATPQRKVVAVSPRRVFTVEHLAYVALAALSVFVHMWALDGRALHHDETIHAFYSWTLYNGQGYLHDPLTHGPFLYYWTALQYMLFGDSEFTARLGAALFGIALTLLPWLMRSDLGKGTALLTATYLLISPVALYVGRFIRHDIFAVTWELLCLIAILRYVATRRVRWLYTFAAAFALMYVTIETSYLFTLTLGTFIILVTLWQVNRRLLIALGLYALLAVGMLKFLPAHNGLVVTQGADGQYVPTLDAQGQQQWLPLPLVTEQQALVVRHQGMDDLLFSKTGPNGEMIAEGYFSKLNKTLFGSDTLTIHKVNNQTLQGENGVFLHANITGVTVLSVIFLALMIWLIWLRRNAERQSMWQRAVQRAGPRTLLPALNSLWSIHGALALGLAFVIYALFFTSFGTHPAGVVSGITGSLLYWVAQHDVQRGGQPQHYYMVQLLVYEPLLLTVGIGSMLAGFGHLAVQIKRGAALTARRMAPGLLGWWAGGSVALYTWAGEKMPWITLHIVVPLTFIAAWGAMVVLRWAFRPVGRRLFGAQAAPTPRQERRLLLAYLGAFVLVALFGLIQLTRAFVVSPEAPTGSASTPWLVFSLLLIWLALTAAYGMWHGPRRAIGGLLIAVGLLWGAYSFRSAWRLNYQNGDIPVEMMVYVQSSPDVRRVMLDLSAISVAETGRMELPIMYDNEQIWKWYVRNYTFKSEFSGAMAGPAAENIQAILMIDSNWNANTGNVQGFVEGRFPLRWWFPEQEFYRFATMAKIDANGVPLKDRDGQTVMEPAPFEQDSTIGRFIRRPYDAKTLNELGRYLLFRQPPAQLSSVDFKVYVRPRYAYMLGLPANNTQNPAQVR